MGNLILAGRRLKNTGKLHPLLLLIMQLATASALNLQKLTIADNMRKY
jgi:hypothetical protein